MQILPDLRLSARFWYLQSARHDDFQHATAIVSDTMSMRTSILVLSKQRFQNVFSKAASPRDLLGPCNVRGMTFTLGLELY